MDSQNQCRASFEAYVLRKTGDDLSMLLRIESNDFRDGEYINENWQRAWLGWRAAWEECSVEQRMPTLGPDAQDKGERMFTDWEGKWRGCSGWRFSALKPNGVRTCVFEVYQGLEKAEVHALLRQLNGSANAVGQ